MVQLNIEDSLVIIIDVQEKLLRSVFNQEICHKNAKIIAQSAELLNIPVVVTEQYPKGLGTTVDSIKEVLPQNIQFYEKTSFSALETPEILDAIKKIGKHKIIILGIETHICVSQTTEALLKAGYEVHVVKDACGSRAEQEYLAGLERMKDNGAHIATTEIVLFELLKSAKHPKFKEIQALIK